MRLIAPILMLAIATCGFAREFAIPTDPPVRLLVAGDALDVSVSSKALHDHCTLITGTVADTSGEDRGVDVTLQLDLAGEGWSFWTDFATSTTKPATQGDFPLAAVTNSSRKLGFALAIPADDPGIFSVRFDGEGLSITIPRGITHRAGGALKGKTPFSFLLFAIDAKWGMRDALAKYYGLYPDLFTRRAKAEGLWLWTSLSGVANPRDYAYHECSPGGDPRPADELGILSFPYFIVGQREIVGIKEPATMPAEQMRLLDAAPGDLRQIIQNSGLHTPDGHLNAFVRQPRWVIKKDDSDSNWPRRLTFPLNPNPALFSEDPNRLTIARSVLASIEQALGRHPTFDGVYLDSLNAWGSYLNFRAEHFAYAQLPLTYDRATSRPALDNQFSHLEFIRLLRTRLHAGNKLLFGNGIGRGRAFTGFTLDVMGSECGAPRLTADNFALGRFFRSVAGVKPYLVLDNHEADWLDEALMRRYWIAATLYGIYPSVHNIAQADASVYRRHKPIIDTYLPIVRQLSAAGWQPVTFAAADQPVLMERFGPDASGNAFLTFYNPLDRNLRVHIASDSQLPVAAAVELLTNTPLNRIELAIDLPSHDLRVIKLAR